MDETVIRRPGLRHDTAEVTGPVSAGESFVITVPGTGAPRGQQVGHRAVADVT